MQDSQREAIIFSSLSSMTCAIFAQVKTDKIIKYFMNIHKIFKIRIDLNNLE